MFDENGNIKGLNYERLIKLARENAARNGADKNTLDFLTTGADFSTTSSFSTVGRIFSSMSFVCITESETPLVDPA